MATRSTSVKFKNGLISKNGDVLMIEEINKDDSIIYNLSSIIEEFEGIEGVAISISVNNDVEADAEE